jgi:hypothetical protein
MQNKSWKKELDLLSEAYSSINETSYKDDKSDALGPGEYICPKTGNVMKDGKVVHVSSDNKKDVKNEELEDIDAIAEPVDSIPGAEIDPDPTAEELDADVQDLITLIANPPPEEELRRLGYEGRLSEYVAMLQKKVDAAQAKLDLKKPAEESNN